MKVTDLIKNSGEPFTSIEIIPPKKGFKIKALFAELEALMKYKPAFMSVTSHAHARSIELVGGKEVERIKSKRLDTNTIFIATQSQFFF